jgi:hypothetical protein
MRHVIYVVSKVLHLSGDETLILRNVDQKYLGSLKIWCWRRMGKINWTDRVRNDVLHRIKGAEISLHTIKRRKVNWIGHILRRNCL